jgi:hypothetical protein
MQIVYGFRSGNLVKDKNLDENASAERFAEQVQAVLTVIYPRAVVDVAWQRGCGRLPMDLVPTIDGDSDAPALKEIAAVIKAVHDCGEWMIQAPDASKKPVPGPLRLLRE